MVACGFKYSLCLTKNAMVYVFGSNYHGQLGIIRNSWYKKVELYDKPMVNGFLRNKVKMQSIQAGMECSMVIDERGRCWSFGVNCCGECGRGKMKDESRWMKSKMINYFDITDLMVGLEDSCVAQIRYGSHQWIIVTDDDEVYGCTRNRKNSITRQWIHTKEKKICSPFRVDKGRELGLDENFEVVRVIGGDGVLIIDYH